jgi:hypothetical protein
MAGAARIFVGKVTLSNADFTLDDSDYRMSA